MDAGNVHVLVYLSSRFLYFLLKVKVVRLFFQSNQVKNSYAMDLEGLKRGLGKLKGRISVTHMITDRHSSVKKHGN